MPILREAGGRTSPIPPPLRASQLPAPRHGFKALLAERPGRESGIGHLAPGSRAAGAVLSPSSALPDVVILLVMASPGSLCLCRFQHLLSEKWEALHETAKDVFFSPQGRRGHGLSIISKISPRHGAEAALPRGVGK